ncbi:MAG: hypothetical protein L0154_12660 [Chloroflexi bacterium]|nr:hypothetical protein [Chloroflexota bacterium]
MIQLPPYPLAVQRRRQVLLVVFIGLAVLYMLVTPAWEASDELWHWGMVEYVAQAGELPVQQPGIETPYQQEGSQPPLYYLLVAALVSPLELHEATPEINPHAKTGIGLATDNQNLTLHDTHDFPWEGAVLATMLGRLFSILLASGTVWLSFAVAILVVPQQPNTALLAMAFTALNPMFIFISASVNNDNLVILLGTLLLAMILSLWRYGWSWTRIGGIAVMLGLAGLTKLSGLTFAPLAGLVILLVYRREKRPFNDLIIATGICAAGVIAIAGWWYLRNVDLYSDITGLNTMVEIAGPRPDDFGLSELWQEREGFFYAHWGWFGGLTIAAPTPYFQVIEVLIVVCLIGLAGYIYRRSQESTSTLVPIVFLLLQFAIIFFGVVRWSLQTPASQGRLLFPAIAAISALLAIGWSQAAQILPRAQLFQGIPAIYLGLAAVILPITEIIPAYRPPETVEELPANILTTDAQWGPIQLLAYDVESTLLPESGGSIDVTLYWRPTAQTGTPLSFFLQVFAPRDDLDGEPMVVGKLDSYPGRGLRRTNQWEPGEIYAETYTIELDEIAGDAVPFQPRIRVGWRDNATNTDIAAQTLDGGPIESVIIRAGTVAALCENPPDNININWSDLVRLRDYTLSGTTFAPGEAIILSALWHVTGTTPDDYAVFVQLVPADDLTNVVANGDAEPRRSWYPTSSWVADTCFEDRYTMPLPEALSPGEYAILVGYYIPVTGHRIPVASTDFYRLDEMITITSD